MPPSPELEKVSALDACIDHLLDGDDWAAALPADPDEAREVAGLMGVARQLLRFSRTLAHPSGSVQFRIWTRVVRGTRAPRPGSTAWIGRLVARGVRP